MKTYHILSIGLLTASMVLTTSCKDSFLEQEPQTKATLEEYFSTEEHVQEAVNACYSPIRVYDYYVNSTNQAMYCPLVFADVMGDDMLVGASGPTDQEVWHLAANYNLSAVNDVWAIWDNSYDGVRAANQAITYCEQNKETFSPSFLNTSEEEARVMRAFYYMQLWKWYGNIPYYTNVLGGTDRIEQLDHDAAYEAIITDLEGAIALNALPLRQSKEENYGRATKALAYMIYAEMVMYQNDQARFQTALKYMQEIINSGEYALDSDYAHLWSPEGEFGSESIFEVNYINGPTSGRSYPDGGDPYKSGNYVLGGTILPRVLGPQGGVAADGVDDGWGTFIPRKTAYEQFAANDTRRDVSCYVPSAGYTKRYQDQGMFCGKYVARTSHTTSDTGGAGDMKYGDNLRVYRFAETLLNAAELLVRTNGDQTQAKKYLSLVRNRAGLGSAVDPTLDNIIQERRLEFLGEGKRYWDLVRMEGVSGCTQNASNLLKADVDKVNDAGDPGRTNNWTANKKYIPISYLEISSAEGGLKQNDDYSK